MRELHSWHAPKKVMPFGVAKFFVVWLDCGHSGGTAKPGDAVTKRLCRHCGSKRLVERVEARHE